MNIGKMRHRVVLLEPVYEEDRGGGRRKTKDIQYEVWADVRTSNYSRATNNKVYGTPVVQEGQTVYIRKKAGNGVKRGWKLILNNDAYDVKNVENIHPEYLILNILRVDIGV